MPSITLFKSSDQTFELFQTKLKSTLDPVLANQLINGLLLKNISLQIGDNVINHLLGRNSQGWILVDQSAGATIYRSQPLNDKTLILNSSAPLTVSLWVF